MNILTDLDMADYHMAMSQHYDLKNKVLDLNRFIASQTSEIEKLKAHIKDLKAAGSFSQDEQTEALLSMLEEKYPGYRVTAQRREIHSLHKVIARLKKELEAEGE